MNRTVYIGAAAVIALAATANAGIQISSTVGDTNLLLTNFANTHNNGHQSGLGLNNDIGFAGSAINFGSLPHANPFPNGNFAVNVAATDGGSFYLGTTGGLDPTYYSAGDSARPADNSLTALAFGNFTYSSNEIVLSFAPNSVTAFGFNYEDIGDVGASLKITLSDGTWEEIDIPGNDNTDPRRDGFISIVSAVNTTIGSITLTQHINPQNDDGFTFYGFTTVQVVPVPTAALAGLGLLIPLGVARRIKRRRA